MSYNVVFEYNEESGGLFGVRTWTSYKSKVEFEASKKNPDESVIDKDVSKDTAINLITLTPEICVLMGAIDEVYRETSNPNTERINYAITGAMYTINNRRKRITDQALDRIDAKKYIAHFKKMIADDPMSFKTASMRGIMAVLLNEYTGEML